MRQIYQSPRLENVERVAEMLKDAGIETWISGGRSYKGNRRRTFSFKESAQEPSGVWIVKAEDLSRATEIMRSTGMLASTRDPGFVPLAGRLAAKSGAPALGWAWRIRLIMLVLLSLLAAATALQMFGGE